VTVDEVRNGDPKPAMPDARECLAPLARDVGQRGAWQAPSAS
jgi:hypothetical protein